MGLSKYKISELISVCDERNSYGYTSFYGLNINKEFMPTWANTEGLDESKYKVVRKKRFVFSGMQTGRDECIRISMYEGEEPIIVSPAYTTFEISREDIVIPEYFFMLFLSKEKDRFGAFCSDGSIRSNLDWERFVDFDITLPSIDQQRKYVDVYLAIQKNLAAYQSKADELKIVCDGLLSNLDGKHCRHEKIGNYIKRNQKRNKEKHYKKSDVRGFNNDGHFIFPMRLFSGDISSFKIIQKNDFVYNSRINSTIKKLSVALNNGEGLIVSPAYESFYVSEEKFLSPYYLYILLQREDFSKKVLFNSFGSSTIVFGFDDLGEIEIPIPEISIQREIVNIHKCYIESQRIAEALKEQLKNICPVLIRGSLEE